MQQQEETTIKSQAAEVETSPALDISNLTAEQKAALLKQLNAEVKGDRLARRDAYEALRADFMHRVEEFLCNVTADVKGFRQWLEKETEAFVDVMTDYGQLRRQDQRNFIITDGDFRISVKCNDVKGFDERADLAAERLVTYLKGYMEQSDKGQDDPMYQLAMTLLERNQKGNLDYKNISKLYEMEDKFNSREYSEIMALFKESNVVRTNATNYYFFKRSKSTGVWNRIEPSFCRL